MEGDPKSESHMSSAAAFVEGGTQVPARMLPAFALRSSVTVILLRCQRSSQCPMCWQPIRLKDPASQELLKAAERERSFRLNQSRNATTFHHPTLGDFEFHHLPAGATDTELEERIIQHLAAAAAMGRSRHIARREGQINRLMAHGRSHVLVFTDPNAPLSGSTISPPASPGEDDQTREVTVVSPSSPLITVVEENPPLIVPAISPQVEQALPSPRSVSVNQQSSPQNNRSPNRSSSSSQKLGGPSDFQLFSENLKNRFNLVSNR